ncbi:MAG: hypothetical protein M3283_11940, partial [Actinomycetota bacterium]|nr:hypothetical protein [Actinomycetota bacterium]
DKKLEELRRIPPARLNLLLDDRDRFCEFDFADSPVSAAERRRLVGELPWPIFAMVARVATDVTLNPAAVAERLDALADELGLSREQAATIEREVLGDPVDSLRIEPRNFVLNRTLDDSTNWLASIVAFSPDGQILASGHGASDSGKVNLWSVHTGELLHTFDGDSELVSSLAFSPDGHLLASGGQDTTVRYCQMLWIET